MAKLTKIEGVGEFYAQKLQEAGVGTTQALLEKGASPKGRQEIAKKTGIRETLILRWVNRVDLFRIKGVGEEYSDLLEAAGVDTVPELAQRNPENLYQRRRFGAPDDPLVQVFRQFLVELHVVHSRTPRSARSHR